MIRSQHSLEHAWLWIAIAWLGIALLVYLSLGRIEVGLPGPNGDKYGHISAYAVLTFWFMQLYDGVRERRAVALLLLALGVVLEIAQSMTGYRTMDPADAVADAIGIALGWLLAPPRTGHLLERIEKVMAGARLRR